MPDPRATAVGSLRQLVTFHLAGERYALDIAGVREILDLPTITPIPLTPPFVQGVVNVRGEIIACIDPAGILGLQRTASTESPALLVAMCGKRCLALVVDAVTGVRHVPECDLEAPSPTLSSAATDFLQAIAQRGEEPLMILDLDKFLAADALRALYG
ncbi:MAG: purine-binding chemotaxis protein CheW [Candidatus Schekmanbacteria bacterium]|nr:purine-binding chemotaxis protein CheW [Candidatus Schekmanbacteria bacterium]